MVQLALESGCRIEVFDIIERESRSVATSSYTFLTHGNRSREHAGPDFDTRHMTLTLGSMLVYHHASCYMLLSIDHTLLKCRILNVLHFKLEQVLLVVSIDPIT